MDLIRPPRFRTMLGPSIVLLGLGLGSGELILWPYLASNFGLGIIWAAVVGITFQFFMNMEIERYTLIKGESIFVGYAKYFRLAPYWFIFSTFISWSWPGIIASSAKIIASIFGIVRFQFLAIGLLILIGLILTLGPKIYKTVERFQKTLIMISLPIILILTLIIARWADWQALGRGLIGIGDGYSFLPKGLPLFTFLGAFAFAGAGGNLNLAQSLYIKEKGYGMCYGTKGITSVLHKKSEKIDLAGQTFSITDENLNRFKKWWRLINLENFLAFLLTGAFTIILLALLSYSSTKGFTSNLQGIHFITNEATEISKLISPFLGYLFLAIVGVTLFACQLTILDSTSRIMSENVVIIRDNIHLAKAYYLILWLQIIAGIIIFLIGYTDPLQLVVTGAVINALAMFIHVGATYLLNKKTLHGELHPSSIRTTIIAIIWLFLGIFSAYSIWEKIIK